MNNENPNPPVTVTVMRSSGLRFKTWIKARGAVETRCALRDPGEMLPSKLWTDQASLASASTHAVVETDEAPRSRCTYSK